MSSHTAGDLTRRSDVRTLDRFPAELLETILLGLSGRDAASCRRVSRTFRDVVDGSLRLQYHIECNLAGVVDNPLRKDIGLQERLERVKGWRDAFATCRWTNKTQVIIEDPVIDEFEVNNDLEYRVFGQAFGPSYVLQSHRRITIVQPPSGYRGRSEKQWTIDLSFTPQELAYDPYQQILALAERIDEQTYGIHLTAPSGSSHPLAAVPIIRVSAAEGLEEVSFVACSVILHSDLLLVSVENTSGLGGNEIWVFNWQTGALLLNLFGFTDDSTEPRGSTFLDSRHILLPVHESFAHNGLIDTAGITVLNLYPPNPLRRSTFEAARNAVLILSLSKPVEGAKYGQILAFGQPPPSLSDATTLRELFFHCPDTSILGVSFDIFALQGQKTSIQSYNIFVLREFIQSLLTRSTTQLGPQPVIVPWNDWAPHTALIPDERGFSDLSGYTPLLASKYFIGPGRHADDLDVFAYDLIPKQRHWIYEKSTPLITIPDQRFWASSPPVGGEVWHRSSKLEPVLHSLDDICITGEDYMVVIRLGEIQTTIVDTYWI